MASFFKKGLLGQDEELDEYYDDEEPVENPRAIRSVFRGDANEDKKGGKGSSMNRNKSSFSNNMEVKGLKPDSMDAAREITQSLLENKTVVLNLEGLNSSLAIRILDFACGSAYALDANIQKIASAIYIIAPESVDINGAFQEYIN